MPDNLLYYGDNLDILRRYVKGESIDLVYLAPLQEPPGLYHALCGERWLEISCRLDRSKRYSMDDARILELA